MMADEHRHDVVFELIRSAGRFNQLSRATAAKSGRGRFPIPDERVKASHQVSSKGINVLRLRCEHLLKGGRRKELAGRPGAFEGDFCHMGVGCGMVP